MQKRNKKLSDKGDQTLDRQNDTELELKETRPEESPAPRRRRRADQYREEPEENREQQPSGRSVLGTSETAREVANRYRQREAQRPAGTASRVPAQAARMMDTLNQHSGNGPEERIGYAPGRMGMGAGARGRVSESGRARLEEESQYRRNEQGSAYGAGERQGRDARVYGRPAGADWQRAEAETGRDSRLPGRPVIGKQKKEQRRHGKALTILVAVLLVLGALLAGILMIPEDAAGFPGTLRQALKGLFGGKPQEAGRVLSFTMEEQAETPRVPADLTFFVLTEKGVADVRIVDPEGEVLPASRMISEQEENTLWELNWHVEEPWKGLVTLQMLAGDSWANTDLTAEAEVLAAYEAIQQAMIDKDIETLDRLYRDGTTFTHMSGKVQTKEEFFGEIADGTLNYFAYDIHGPRITVDGDEAFLTASVTLTAKVYGASGSWTLPVNAHFTKIDGQWIAHN